jgi:hypothetical protein
MSDPHNQVVFTNNEVVISDVKVPFWSMVVILVKLAIAAIPAFIILTVIGVVTMGLLQGLTST